VKLPPAVARKCLELAGDKPADRRPPPSPAGPLRRLAVEAEVGVRTASEANVGGTLRGKLARKGRVKEAVRSALPRLGERFPLPVRVTLTRVSGGRLDDDNLRPALKAVRDVVAAWLGLDDADPRVRWVYRQRAGWAAAVTIRVEHAASD
jgi:hypothetical protein